MLASSSQRQQQHGAMDSPLQHKLPFLRWVRCLRVERLPGKMIQNSGERKGQAVKPFIYQQVGRQANPK
jgi:hypothetical protein